MNFNLDDAVNHLVTQIKQYESDTWSSSETGVDEETAKKMAAELIYQMLFQRDGTPINVDGAEIGLAYDTVQETEQKGRTFKLMPLEPAPWD